MASRHLHLTVPEDIYKDVKQRKGFLPSPYFVVKYTEEFLTEKTRKKEIVELSDRLAQLKKEQRGIQETTPVKVGDPKNRCSSCHMLYNEKVSFRKKVQTKDGKYMCAECAGDDVR